MDISLKSGPVSPQGHLQLGGSKSETNRLLLLQALYPNLGLENTSESDDAKVMQAAFRNETGIIDIHHAGTTMRFLSAYFAMQQGKTITLTGSARMKERPIQILVDALRSLGAEISYLEKEGYPPLAITGRNLTQNKLSLAADVSSQYISALLLIAPKLENGLRLTLEGTITSRPYIQMTLGLLRQIGVAATFSGNTILVEPQKNIRPQTVAIESDWSSASYFYGITALSPAGTCLSLSAFKKDSLQGDSALAEIYSEFGVDTAFDSGLLILTKTTKPLPAQFARDLNHTPDLAQTIAATCLGLGVPCQLSGLHTLKIKETDRLAALQNELAKLGAQVTITTDSLSLRAVPHIRPNSQLETYQDHRMAMALATLAVKVPLLIQDAEVVTKSYPAFWDDLKKIGFVISEVPHTGTQAQAR